MVVQIVISVCELLNNVFIDAELHLSLFTHVNLSTYQQTTYNFYEEEKTAHF